MGKLTRDASRIVEAAGGPIDVAVVLGSGLSAALDTLVDGQKIPYRRLKTLASDKIAGHAGYALAGDLHGARLLAFAGRAHLYQGFDAFQVAANVRLAHAAGARTIVLTNAAGSLNPAMAAGDVMLIADHINLTGQNPLSGTQADRFVDMQDAYAERLRALVREDALHEGVYAGVSGPNYETIAESRYLRGIGADAVGMSTVLETIQARALGLEVVGTSAIANALGDGRETTHADVAAAAAAAGPRIAAIVAKLVDAMGPPRGDVFETTVP